MSPPANEPVYIPGNSKDSVEREAFPAYSEAMASDMAEQMEELELASLESIWGPTDDDLGGCDPGCTMGSQCTFRTVPGEPFDGMKYIEHHYSKRQLGFKIQEFLNSGVKVEDIWAENERREKGQLYKTPARLQSSNPAYGSGDGLVSMHRGSYRQANRDKIPVTTTTNQVSAASLFPQIVTSFPASLASPRSLLQHFSICCSSIFPTIYHSFGKFVSSD